MYPSEAEFMVAMDRYALVDAQAFTSDMLALPLVAWLDASGADALKAVFVAPLHPGRAVDATSAATPLCTITREPLGSSPTAFGYLSEGMPPGLVEAIASTGLLGVMVSTVDGHTACSVNEFDALPNIASVRAMSYGLVAHSLVGDVTLTLRTIANGLRWLEHHEDPEAPWRLVDELEACCIGVDDLYAAGTLAPTDARLVTDALDDASRLIASGVAKGRFQAGLTREAVIRARSLLLSSVVADLRRSPAVLASRPSVESERADYPQDRER